AHGSTEDDAAARLADEVDEVLHLGTAERGIALDLLEGAAGVEFRRQQIAICLLELLQQLGREAAARKADGVEAVDARAIADSLRVRQRVLRDHREAADEGIAPDAAELMDARERADRRDRKSVV